VRRLVLPVFLVSTIGLGGCVAGMAASALGAAARASEAGRATADPELAREACVTRAAQHGQVKVIDVEQRTNARVVVWGTTESQQERQSFECTYTGKIAGFRLRPLKRP
jgi:hypothetical protein